MTSVVVISDGVGAPGGGETGISTMRALRVLSVLTQEPRTPGRAIRDGSLGVAASVLVRGVFAVLVEPPHEVVVRIERVVAFDAVADLEIARGRRAAIDEVV